MEPSYASFQLAKALTTYTQHDDPETRERARHKAERWVALLQQWQDGQLAFGSRTPVEGGPAWATLEVLTGGFASGALLAEGPLLPHEQARLAELAATSSPTPRGVLQADALSEDGFAALTDRLHTGHYQVGVPEEGALLTVAALVEQGKHDEAHALLEELSPWFERLRFYPIPTEQPQPGGAQVALQSVAQTITALQRVKTNTSLLAQKEAVEVWAPLYDQLVGLFLETVEDGWPCRHFPEDWHERGKALLADYAQKRRKHRLCGKPERRKENFAVLRALLSRCLDGPEALPGHDVGRLRLILERTLQKRGAPDSLQCQQRREQQTSAVRGPLHKDLATRLAHQLKEQPAESLMENLPPSLERKLARCIPLPVGELVARRLLTSGEALAKVLPQVTSEIQAAGFTDPALRQLSGALYQAFRRRRSLLLLNLEHQVRFEELPWVAALNPLKTGSLSTQAAARATLEEVTLLTLTAFPQTILPNKLLQELQALTKTADLALPLTEELAVDIFMGKFTSKFVEAAKRSAALLEGTLYARYYEISTAEVQALRTPEALATLCAARAGTTFRFASPANSGRIIEQQQILTTHNLAPLFAELGLSARLETQLKELARRCFIWVCRRLQSKTDRWHARLIQVKNTAYAWRQMLFFLSFVPEEGQQEFLLWAERVLSEQDSGFQARFAPAFLRLKWCISPEQHRLLGGRPFLGWSSEKHWLLAD